MTLVRPIHALRSPKTSPASQRPLVPGVTWLWASPWRDDIYGGVKHEQEIPKMSQQVDEQSASAPTLKLNYKKWFRGSRNLRIRKF